MRGADLISLLLLVTTFNTASHRSDLAVWPFEGSVTVSQCYEGTARMSIAQSTLHLTMQFYRLRPHLCAREVVLPGSRYICLEHPKPLSYPSTKCDMKIFCLKRNTF